MEVIPRNPFSFKSIFEEIKGILSERNFLDSRREVGEQETVLGEMTEEEKAIFSVANRLEAEQAEKLFKLSKFRYQNALMPGEERIGQMDLNVSQLRTLLVKGLLILIVNDRIGWDTAGGAVAFRKGFKIVAEKSEESLTLSLKIMPGP